MLIARKLRKENIVEYLLYMWQIEDLLRAFNFDINLINEKIVSQYTVNEQDKKEIEEWYESLTDMMLRENVKKEGHLQINKNVMLQLSEFHEDMLRTNKDAAYSAKFIHILPLILQLRKQQTDTTISDTEVCLNFLYGIMALRMKGEKITPETERAQQEISKFLVLMAKNYNEFKKDDNFFAD